MQLDADHAKQLLQLQDRVEAGRAAGQPFDVANLDSSLNYQDPVGRLKQDRYGGSWLAAFWPVGRTDWVAVVQERQSTAKHPMQQMEQRLNRYMRLGLLVCCGLIGAMWYFIARVLSNQARTS